MKKFIFVFIAILFLVQTGLICKELNNLTPNIFTKEGDPKRNLSKDAQRKPSIGVVLSGGGARGIAHIGVLQVLERLNIPIDYIGGTSFGALVASFYAAGYSPKEIEQIIKGFNWKSAFQKKQERQQYYYYTRQEIEANVMRFRFSNWRVKIPNSFTNSQKILNKLLFYFTRPNYISGRNFFDLNPPLLISTTNIISGKNRIYESGDLVKVIQASLSVPLLFPPVEMDSALYVDGGITNNLPINAMKEMGADLIIASNTSHFLNSKKEMNSVLAIADQLINIMMFNKIESELDIANVVLRPQVENISNTDFSKINELLLAGRDATLKHTTELKKLTRSSSRSGVVIHNSLEYNKSQISIEGNSQFTDSTLLENIPEFISSEKVENISDEIINIYKKSGFILAEVDSVKHSPEEICFFVNEGMIETVDICGNDLTKKKFILTEIPVSSQRIFNIKDVMKGVEGIYSTNLFEIVSYETKKNPNGNVDLTYQVKEKAYGIIEVGLNYNSEQNTSSFVSIGDENIWGTGNAIEMFARFGNEHKFGIDFRDDKILNTNFNSHFKFYFLDDIDIEEDREWNFIFDNGFFDKEKLGLFSIILDYKQSNLQGRERTVGMGVELIFDDYDRFPYPKRGIKRKFSYMTFNKQLGSKYNFQNYKFENQIYYTPFKGITLSGSIHLNLNHTESDIPVNRIISHRPSNTFFGYHYEDVQGEDLFYLSPAVRLLLKKFAARDPRDALYLIAQIGIGEFGEIRSMEKFWDIFIEKNSVGYKIGLEMPTILGPAKIFFEESEENSFWNLSIGYEF